jgi:hypothetical protein
MGGGSYSMFYNLNLMFTHVAVFHFHRLGLGLCVLFMHVRIS